MNYSLTGNPALATRFFIEDKANFVAESVVPAGHEFRVEPATGAPGLVIRVWSGNDRPAWVCRNLSQKLVSRRIRKVVPCTP